MKKKRIGWLLLVIFLVAAGFGGYYAFSFYEKSAYPVKYEHLVQSYSAEQNLDEDLVYAVIRTESSFRPLAESSVGARGLMQITEETFDFIHYRLGGTEQTVFADLFDPETNIRFGTFLLRILIDEFGSVSNALCAYHAGWGNAKKWLANEQYAPDGKEITNIPFGDTGRYVKKVLKTWEKYQTLYAE